MTTGAEIHDGCPSFSRENLEGRLPFLLENLEGRLLIFLLMFFARKTVRKPVFCKNQFFAHVFSVFYMSKNLYGGKYRSSIPG